MSHNAVINNCRGNNLCHYHLRAGIRFEKTLPENWEDKDLAVCAGRDRPGAVFYCILMATCHYSPRATAIAWYDRASELYGALLKSDSQVRYKDLDHGERMLEDIDGVHRNLEFFSRSQD